MEISKSLKFVRGAVANKTPVDEMKHFMIENGYIRSTNGVLSLGAPIDFSVDCSPNADMLYKAVGNCKDVVNIKMTPAGRLSLSSGQFRALIPCLPMDSALFPRPTGQRIDFDGNLLVDAFKTLEPFVGKDELRPWSTGILLNGQSAFATNNTCVVEYWIGVPFPHLINLPLPAVKEVLRIKELPHAMFIDERSVSFIYEDERWIKTQLYDTEWPNVMRILNQKSEPRAIPEGFFEGVNTVGSFNSGTVVFEDGKIMNDEGTVEFAVEGLPVAGAYNSAILKLLEGVAETADFDRYPAPAMFFGENVRGALAGMARKQ